MAKIIRIITLENADIISPEKLTVGEYGDFLDIRPVPQCSFCDRQASGCLSMLVAKEALQVNLCPVCKRVLIVALEGLVGGINFESKGN